MSVDWLQVSHYYSFVWYICMRYVGCTTLSQLSIGLHGKGGGRKVWTFLCNEFKVLIYWKKVWGIHMFQQTVSRPKIVSNSASRRNIPTR
jgi:hypothetical protein